MPKDQSTFRREQVADTEETRTYGPAFRKEFFRAVFNLHNTVINLTSPTGVSLYAAVAASKCS